MKEILEAKKIIVNDYRDWVPGKDSNGGCYSYHYIFEAVEGGFKVTYSTSAEFEFCTKYGYFTKCDNCQFSNWHGDIWSCTAPGEIWSMQKLIDFINDNNDEGFEVFIE